MPPRSMLTGVAPAVACALSLGCGGSGRVVVSPPPDGPSPLVVCLGLVDVDGGLTPLVPSRPGRVTEVVARDGDAVELGAVLLRTDSVPSASEVAAARAALRGAEARLSLARQDARCHPLRLQQARLAVEVGGHRVAAAKHILARVERLVGQNQATQREADAAAEQFQAAESEAGIARAKLAEVEQIDPSVPVAEADAAVDAAKARLALAEHALGECELKAPSRGRVFAASVRRGELIGAPGAPPAFLFGPEGGLVVRAEVEQEFARLVRPGQPVQVCDDSVPGDKWQGVVGRVGRQFSRRHLRADPTQFSDVPTVEVTVDLASGHPEVRVGQRVRVSIFPIPVGTR